MNQTPQMQPSSKVLRLLTRHLELNDYSKGESRLDLMHRAWMRTGRHLRGALEDYGEKQEFQDNHSK